ncbi:MAG: hypothetical protein H0V96_12870, partial [Acidimicrobiia bacterium]|nr:hypothetical protein [Acidimicrobiia bacterium]
RGGWWLVLWAVGIVTAALTAFYMSRMMFLTFFGEPRGDDGVHPHESAPLITLPLAALGGLALVGGLVNTPFAPVLEHFLEPSFEAVEQAHLPGGITPWLLAVVSVGAGVAGIMAARRRYLGEELPEETGATWELVEGGYRVDDVYGDAVVIPARKTAEALAFVADARVVDGAVNGTGWLVQRLAAMLRPIQTGFARSYVLGVLAGTVGLVVWLLVRGAG